MEGGLWNRRSNTNTNHTNGRLSLSTPNSNNGERDRTSSISRLRGGGGDSSSHGGRNPFNLVTTPGSAAPSPGGADFGLGTGAFSSFGSAKPLKSPGNPLDGAKGAGGDKAPKDGLNGSAASKLAGGDAKAGAENSSKNGGGQPTETVLRTPWCFWFRPSIPKNVSIPYDETVHGMAEVATVEQFWTVYRHLARPSNLNPVSDYHLFKKGVRPIWEDKENRNGGKWLVRLKKGVADRYWEDLMLALIGDQFNDTGVEVCGAVVSVRNGEDIISIWVASKQDKMIRIRDTFKKILQLPANTKIEWKVHEESIQQRITIEESRKEKAANQHQHQHRGNSRTSATKSQPLRRRDPEASTSDWEHGNN